MSAEKTNFDMFGLNISKEFISDVIKVTQREKRKGGPYSKNERNARQNEVYRLHFEMGYSAAKISQMMKINRNTVSIDINFWYSKLSKEWRSYDFDSFYMKQFYRLESQRARLLVELEKQVEMKDRMIIERFILDIDTKLISMATRIDSSTQAVTSYAEDLANNLLKQNNIDKRIMSTTGVVASPKTIQKIMELLKQDKERRIGKG